MSLDFRRKFFPYDPWYQKSLKKWPHEVILVMTDTTGLKEWFYETVGEENYDIAVWEDISTHIMYHILWFTEKHHALEFKLRFG